MARKKTVQEGDGAVTVKGFFRLNIVEDDPVTGKKKIVGDSGWVKNQVTNLGISYYLCDVMGASSDSKLVNRMCIGNSNANPASNATVMGSEHSQLTDANSSRNRPQVTYAKSGSNTARFTATWYSSLGHVQTATTVNNLALINNTLSGGTILCGKTFSSSAWGTNQDIYATYDFGFSTA
jgi:hypothetical protein